MGHLPRENTPSGSVAPSWLPSPPSRKCGSPSRSSTRLVPALSTANASKSFVDSSTSLRFSSLFLFIKSFVSIIWQKKKKHICIQNLTGKICPIENANVINFVSFLLFFLKKKKRAFFLKKKKKKKKKK